MDLQTYKSLKTRSIFVINSTKHCTHSLKTVKDFVNGIEPGSLLLIEFPLFLERRCTGGPASFSIEVTNLTTLKTLKMKPTELYEKIFSWIEDFKELDML
jgi:hypothetical protein